MPRKPNTPFLTKLQRQIASASTVRSGYNVALEEVRRIITRVRDPNDTYTLPPAQQGRLLVVELLLRGLADGSTPPDEVDEVLTEIRSLVRRARAAHMKADLTEQSHTQGEGRDGQE